MKVLTNFETKLLAALELVLMHEGKRQVNGIGIEFDLEELEDAKNYAWKVIKEVKESTK